jgi:hypothetical protein
MQLALNFFFLLGIKLLSRKTTTRSVRSELAGHKFKYKICIVVFLGVIPTKTA